MLTRTTELPRNQLQKWFLVVFQGVAILLGVTIAFMVGPMLVALSEEFSISVGVAGQLVAADSFAWAITGPLAGAVADMYGRRRVMGIGFALVFIGVAASGFTTNYSQLLMLRILSGAGSPLIMTVGMAVLSDHIPARSRGPAIGLALTIGSVAIVGAIPAMSLVTDIAGWRVAFYIMSVLTALLWIVFSLWFPKDDRNSEKPRNIFYYYKQVLKERQFWCIAMSHTSFRTVSGGILTYGAAYLIQTYTRTEGEVALPLVLVGLGVTAGSLLGGGVAALRYRLAILTMLAAAIGIGGAVLFAYQGAFWVSVTLSGLVLAMTYMTVPTTLTLVMDLGSDIRATALGLLEVPTQAGFIIGASLGGFLITMGGFSATAFLWLLAGLFAAAVVRFLWRESVDFIIGRGGSPSPGDSGLIPRARKGNRPATPWNFK